MSKNKLIALAIAAALASPAAYAVDVDATTPAVLPTNAMTGVATVQTNGAINIVADATDNYLGRSTGYNVRVTLSDGAVFNTAFNPADVAFVSADAHTGTVTIAGGGQVGDNSITFSVVPNDGTTEGDGIAIAAGAFDLKNIGFLATGSNSLEIDVRVGDPVGGGELASRNGTPIISSQQAWVVTYSAGGNTAERIDVGASSGKKLFSSTGAVNLADTNVFNTGSLAISLNPALTNNMGLDPAVATAPLVISGADFSAFEGVGSVHLDDDASCDGLGTVIAAVVSGDNTSAAIPSVTTAAAVNASPFICFAANGTTIIEDQDVDATVTVKQVGMVDSPAFADGDTLLPMLYNGAVKRVWHFNPSTNRDQQSYLRITNSSSTAGLFTIDGTCDDASAGNPVTFTLGSGRSILLTSGDIENGNADKGLTGAMGACTPVPAAGVTGKRRLVITGEVGSMEVQGFLRNGTSAGQINTNVNNAD